MTKLAVLVFGLVLVSFVIRGFGRFVVGPRTATLVAGPVAVVAAGVLVLLVAVRVLALIGVTSVEEDADE